MPTITPTSLHFTALRRFDIELGAGAIVAVFFGPTMQGCRHKAAADADQHHLQQKADRVPTTTGAVILLPVGRVTRGTGAGATHG